MKTHIETDDISVINHIYQYVLDEETVNLIDQVRLQAEHWLSISEEDIKTIKAKGKESLDFLEEQDALELAQPLVPFVKSSGNISYA